MTHRLAKPGEPRNGIGLNPLTVSLRHQCACGNRELLTIQTVLDMDLPEKIFIHTMRALWRDMRMEVAQHLREAEAV